MTDNEIEKDLKELHQRLVLNYNDGIPFEQFEEDRLTVVNALDIIDRKNAELSKKDTEINILIRKKEALSDEISELKAEIERLKQQPISVNVIKTIQTDILKVFAERLKSKVENIPWCEYHLIHTEIDNLVKEMTEGGAE